jgi:hypothetical protein
LSRIPWARSAFGWLAQSLHEMQCVRVVCGAGRPGILREKSASSLVSVEFSIPSDVKSWHEGSWLNQVWSAISNP